MSTRQNETVQPDCARVSDYTFFVRNIVETSKLTFLSRGVRLHPESIEKAASFVAKRLNDPILHSSLQTKDDAEDGDSDKPRPNPQVSRLI